MVEGTTCRHCGEGTVKWINPRLLACDKCGRVYDLLKPEPASE